MRIIDSKVELISEKDPLKKIEIAGRTCYRSELVITDGSAEKFFNRLVVNHHYAMFEHAFFVFRVPYAVYMAARAYKHLNATEAENVGGDAKRWLVSGNLRAIKESGFDALTGAFQDNIALLLYCKPDYRRWKGTGGTATTPVDFEALPDKTPEEIAAHRYTTMRFTTDRGVSHELVRHRLFSFAQESTRYCNYTKAQFSCMQFIKPAGYDYWNTDMQEFTRLAFEDAEKYYNRLIACGASAQQARAVLPNGLKTEVIVTGNDAEWQHFFNLRSRGTTGAPHPDMKIVADQALALYQEIYPDCAKSAS